LIECLFGFCLCSCCPLHLLRLYSYTPSYPTVLTIVHLDGTSILSLYNSNNLFSIWSLFFTLNIMQLIVHCTNQRGRLQKSVPSLSNTPAALLGAYHCRWFDLTVYKLYSYFSILVYIALTPLSHIELYWGLDRSQHEYITSAMTYDRFKDISRVLCITNGIHSEFA
jgi:Transposase IS4